MSPKNNKQPKKLVLLDAHAILHRAYHALPEFSSSKGEPTGALYGFVAMILKIVQEIKPDYLIACYDLPDKTFRHEAYDKYKSGRKKADDALVVQLNRSRDICDAFAIPIYDAPGFEADDILGTITQKVIPLQNLSTIIATGDMDTLQLVSKKDVQVYTLRKGINDTVLYDELAVERRFGFTPKLLPDWKGLRGDPSDNIPGIRGIGEKTATTLISTYGTLEHLYRELKKSKEEVKKKTGLSDRIISLLVEGEEEALFSKTLAFIRKDAPISFQSPQALWRTTVEPKQVEELFSDLEFRSLRNRFHSIFGERKEDTNEKDTSKQTEEHEDPKKVQCLGIALWLLNSEMTNPSREDILSYTHEDSLGAAEKKLFAELRDKKLEEVYQEIELPIIPFVDAMHTRGVSIDTKYLEKLSKRFHKDLSTFEEAIWKEAGKEFNINSPKQLGEVLFDSMGISTKGLKKTTGGARSTRESELKKLENEYPFVKKILQYRELQKLLSTYIDAIPALVENDGRLHATFIQTGTTTGRFSSQNPNLQNIPTRDDEGKNIRNAFVASNGFELLACDYSQIELRVAAILSNDPEYLKIFKEGKDVHAAVASRMFGVSENAVTSEMRRRAKTINFGIIYGMGVNALKESLGTSRAEAAEFYENYFEKFSQVAEYLEKTKAFAHKHGYTETLLGRRRYFPALRSPLPYIRAAAERMATNAPIQGTATADIIKLAIRFVGEYIEREKLTQDVFPLMQIHDELIFEVKEEKLKDVAPIIRNIMEHVLENSFARIESPVPLVVNMEHGIKWGDMTSL